MSDKSHKFSKVLLEAIKEDPDVNTVVMTYEASQHFSFLDATNRVQIVGQREGGKKGEVNAKVHTFEVHIDRDVGKPAMIKVLKVVKEIEL